MKYAYNIKQISFNGLIALLLLFGSCETQSENPAKETSKVQFSFSNVTSRSAFQSKAGPNDAKSIVVSIEQSGSLVYDKVNLTLFDFNGSLVTTPLALPIGNYSITEFFVIDSLDSVIYATPLEGSLLENLVVDPLPIEFSVILNQTVIVNPQVISTASNNPSDFGFFGFGFEIVETFDFLVSVQVYDDSVFTATTALVEVESDGHLDYSQTIPNTITTIKSREILAATYTVTVIKAGYQDYQQSFTLAELKAHDGLDVGEVPLVITLLETAAVVEPIVSTIAGNGVIGFTNGAGSVAQFNLPHDLAMDNSGNIYVTDGGNHSIRKITIAGVVSTFAGTGVAGFVDGAGSVAQFSSPQGISIDNLGNLYVADSGNNRVRKISPTGVVSTIAGSTQGYLNGNGISARFNNPHGLAVDQAGNVFVADMNNDRIRKIDTNGDVTTYAGQISAGFSSGYVDGASASARFSVPMNIAIDATGNLYVTDGLNYRIRKISNVGIVTTFAGNGYGSGDGPIATARFNFLHGIAISASGDVYVAEGGAFTIRKITQAGIVSSLTNTGGNNFVDGLASVARFYNPTGVAFDSNGDLYVADYNNQRIRKVTF